MNKPVYLLLAAAFCVQSCHRNTGLTRTNQKIIWQPSHQTDTGKDFHEASVCNGIVIAAMNKSPKLKEYKVWSLGKTAYHHADSGSNTKIAHTTEIINNRISGYAYELNKSNKIKPTVFIAIHNNGGTKRHAIWGYIHYGDSFEKENRELALLLVNAISAVTTLENRGVLLDSTTGRNDYRCSTTGKLGFYSLDENINHAPYRVLLEIGDNGVSREFLQNPLNQKIIGESIKTTLAKWISEKRNPG